MTPLMGFAAPSAHAAQEIHQRGVPSPLRSAFAVGSALTVCSLPCLVGLFRPTALMGFRVEPLRVASAFAASSCSVFDRSAALRCSSAPPEGDGSEQVASFARGRSSIPDRGGPATEVVGPGRAPTSASRSRSEDRRREGRQGVTGSARDHETEVSKISSAGYYIR
jgi:hypothetical protein